MPPDSHHLFLSYARADNRTGRVSEFAGRLTAAYRTATGRDLLIFFDADSLEGGDRWLDHILRQLKQSKILLACLSPAYLESDFCRQEFAEYLRGETGRGLSGSGILPVWAFDIPNWQDRSYDDAAPDWVRLLRQRNYTDLRAPFASTDPASTEPAPTARLIEQIAARIRRVEAAERSPSWTLPPHNERFTGREGDMERLSRCLASPGRAHAITVLHGLGGIGKSALAAEYAHNFADRYPAGRWYAPCGAAGGLREALAERSPVLPRRSASISPPMNRPIPPTARRGSLPNSSGAPSAPKMPPAFQAPAS